VLSNFAAPLGVAWSFTTRDMFHKMATPKLRKSRKGIYIIISLNLIDSAFLVTSI